MIPLWWNDMTSYLEIKRTDTMLNWTNSISILVMAVHHKRRTNAIITQTWITAASKKGRPPHPPPPTKKRKEHQKDTCHQHKILQVVSNVSLHLDQSNVTLQLDQSNVTLQMDQVRLRANVQTTFIHSMEMQLSALLWTCPLTLGPTITNLNDFAETALYW